ncbi:hypothetical protein [Paenibacillus sp. GCM10027626]|uniref:hypothetical protein n=1 Tax=Paenibacillus sp. GCM10027626 TaxID=3273411 RepID=UPI00363FCC8F
MNKQLQQLEELQMLRRKIESKESAYNPEIQMLTSPFSSPGYHTTIKKAETIHSTLNSLIYALGLLDTGEERYRERACEIILQVVSLQDTDRSRDTFGIWSWFYEEPLDQMSPPDWNWADFCGKLLVLALSRHGNKFSGEQYEAVKQAIYNACDAIIKRNVGPGYTNIAIMGAFVTLIAGELFGEKKYEMYGLNRLEKLHQFTQVRQAFQEYNSPPYTTVAILELSKLHTETKLERAKQLSGELLDMTWNSVADYYHTATGQWSGPHSRCYSTLLSENHKAFLQYATRGKLKFYEWSEFPYEEEWYKSGLHCPEDIAERMLISEERELRKCFAVNEHDQSEKWATTFMTPAYTLGSFNKEIMWNQTRTVLAYLDNGGQPTYMHLRCLHDGYDYCSAILSSVQRKEHVLYGVHFMTNGGDTHPNLDKIDGTIEAADFRLRLEIGGSIERVESKLEAKEAIIRIGGEAGITVQLYNWFAAFDDRQSGDAFWRWEINEENGVLGIDWVIYSGERRTIDFRELNKAALLFSIMLNNEEQKFSPSVQESNGQVAVTGTWNNEEMSLAIPLQATAR